MYGLSDLEPWKFYLNIENDLLSITEGVGVSPQKTLYVLLCKWGRAISAWKHVLYICCSDVPSGYRGVVGIKLKQV